ncbi:MAG TPA: hypothetical protein VFQ60_01285 [Patescibacteria group bacterium]|nr:hypothetical protein [Patescibacteria group bacterium]
MSERLIDAVKDKGLSDRTELILTIAPECLFGFSPPDLEQMIERLDCGTCREIMNVVAACEREFKELTRRVNEVREPVRFRNVERKSLYRLSRLRYFFTYFSWSLRLEPEPDLRNESWHQEITKRIEVLSGRLPEMAAKDHSHWGDEQNRKISRNLIARFVRRDCVYV